MLDFACFAPGENRCEPDPSPAMRRYAAGLLFLRRLKITDFPRAGAAETTDCHHSFVKTWLNMSSNLDMIDTGIIGSLWLRF